MNVPLSTQELDALRRLDACTLANLIETFQRRLEKRRPMLARQSAEVPD